MRRLGDLPRPRLGSVDRRSAGTAALLAAILLSAAALRLMRAPAGTPYLNEWDEPLIASRALRMMQTGDYNPHAFEYGSLMIYLNLFVDIAHYIWLMKIPPGAPGSLGGLEDIRTFFDTGWLWTISHPSFYIWNRALTAAFGTASVGLVYMLARMIAGSWAGLLAAAFLAGLEYHVAQSALVLPNVPVSAFTLLVTLLSIIHLERGGPAHLLGALAACGLAASTKYNAAISVVTPMFALAGSTFRRSGPRHAWLWGAVVIVPPLAFLAGTPYAALDLGSFLDGLGKQAREYFALGHGRATVEPGIEHLLLQLGTISRLLGVIGTALALLGITQMCSNRWGRIALLLPVAYLIWMTRTRVSFHRNFVLIYPFAAVAVGCGGVLLCRLVAWSGGRFRLPVNRTKLATGAALLVFVLVTMGGAAAQSGSAWSLPESRTQALRTAAALIRSAPARPGRVGVAEELRVHPLDLHALAVLHVVAPLPDLLCEPAGALAIVMSAGRYAVKENANGPDAELRNEILSVLGRPVASIGTRVPFDLDGISPNPLIVLVPAGRGAGDGALECAAPIRGQSLIPEGAGGAAGKEEARIRLNGSLSTPAFAVRQGAHAVSVRARRSPGSSRSQRLRVTLLQRAGDGSLQPRTLREIILSSEMTSHLMRFDMDRRAEVAVRLELTDRPPGGDAGAYAAVDSVRLITLPVGTVSPPGEPLPPSE